MGIYTNGRFFGLLYKLYENNECITIYEKIFTEEMNNENIKEAFEFYNTINFNDNLKQFKFFYYTPFISTVGNQSHMDWYPITKNKLDIWFTRKIENSIN